MIKKIISEMLYVLAFIVGAAIVIWIILDGLDKQAQLQQVQEDTYQERVFFAAEN